MEKYQVDHGNRLSDAEDVDAALDNLLITCDHAPADVLVSGMAEVIGGLVRRGRIGHAEVHALVEAALPVQTDNEVGEWPED